MGGAPAAAAADNEVLSKSGCDLDRVVARWRLAAASNEWRRSVRQRRESVVEAIDGDGVIVEITFVVLF